MKKIILIVAIIVIVSACRDSETTTPNPLPTPKPLPKGTVLTLSLRDGKWTGKVNETPVKWDRETSLFTLPNGEQLKISGVSKSVEVQK